MMLLIPENACLCKLGVLLKNTLGEEQEGVAENLCFKVMMVHYNLNIEFPICVHRWNLRLKGEGSSDASAKAFQVCYLADKAKESVLKTSIHLWMVRHNLLPRSHTAPIKVGDYRDREVCVWDTLSSGKYLGPKARCQICSIECISFKNNRGHSLSNLNHMLKFRFGLHKMLRGTQDPHMK